MDTDNLRVGREGSSELLILWKHFNRHRFGILGMALLGVMIAGYMAMNETPLFRATASLLIEPKVNQVVNINEVYDPMTETGSYFSTQIEVMRSRDLINRVVSRLDLVNDPEFMADRSSKISLQFLLKKIRGLVESLASRLPGLTDESKGDQKLVATGDPALRAQQAATARFISQLTVEPVFRTQLVRIHFVSEDRQLAARAVNAVADVYIESGLEARLEATQRATGWLNEKIITLKENLQRSEKALQTYRDQQKLVVVGSAGLRGLVDAEILDNSRRLRDAQRVKAELQSTYQKIRQAGDSPEKLKEIRALFGEQSVQRANSNLLAVSEEMRQLEERYGDKHPQMTQAKARLSNAKAAFTEQLRLAAEGVRNQYEIAIETERQLEAVVARDTERIRQLDRNEYELRTLEREAQVNRELYDVFLTRFKEADSTINFEPVNARVIDPALVPNHPYLPNKSKMIFIGGLLGFLAGILMAALRTLLDETVTDPDELEQITGLSILGMVPLVTGRKDRTNLIGLFHHQPRTGFAEGVRSVRAAVQIGELDKRRARVVVTSSAPGEGKTSIICALGMALAAKERVLLVEGDMRLPNLKKSFRMPKDQPGLLERLLNSAPLEQCIWKHEPTGLDILPVAKVPPNPSDVISSEAFESLLAELATRYDRILIDSPPTQVASDASVLASRANAVIFVVSAGSTKRREIVASVKQLNLVHAPLVGVVINQVDVRRHSDIYGSYYYAYNYYGK